MNKLKRPTITFYVTNYVNDIEIIKALSKESMY